MTEIKSKWNIVSLMIFFTILGFTYHIGQLLWGIVMIATLFWIFMLCDCLQRNTDNFPRKGEHDKLIWSLSIIFLNFIGAIMYYFLVRMQEKGDGINMNETIE
ncbi:PLD nuclease N-terminal domain-containing protein [Methanococcoides sp. NM1]|uniref:PLD nuclease N-terminal domain-containing protein n=1 Tax=Methanococcoides sp. NM1 TaxID=1201013 RepID=UPI001AEFB191|nr:PLD nuclease N-terminal domain-containing protein [Methanococcoides sp. NM1]